MNTQGKNKEQDTASSEGDIFEMEKRDKVSIGYYCFLLQQRYERLGWAKLAGRFTQLQSHVCYITL